MMSGRIFLKKIAELKHTVPEIAESLNSFNCKTTELEIEQ